MKKHITLFVLLFLTAFCGQAKELADGYIITSGGDTIRCQIVLQTQFKNRYDMYQQIETIDDSRKHTTYYAKDGKIAGFGFDYKDKPECYMLRKEGSNLLFEYCELSGRRLRLYSYCTLISCGMGLPARVKVFVMENHTREAIRIHTGLFASGKQNIREFLFNDHDLLPLFDGMVSRFADIRAFVSEANKFYN